MSIPSEIQDDYFDWLMDIFEEREQIEEYSMALIFLYKTAFRCAVPLDENRLDDVRLYLRNHYVRRVESPSQGNIFATPSVLEVLMATCMRFCDEVGEEFNGELLPTWEDIFWDALHNVGIVPLFDDESFKYKDYEGVNLETSLASVVRKFNTRSYSPDGDGSLFPLRKCTEDQRKIDLWRQIHLYISEVYNFYRFD